MRKMRTNTAKPELYRHSRCGSCPVHMWLWMGWVNYSPIMTGTKNNIDYTTSRGMRDKCPKCEGDLLLLENSATIYCMDCCWNISVRNWQEWNTLKELTIWVIGQYAVHTNALPVTKCITLCPLLTSVLTVMRGEDDALRIIREI